MNGKRIHGAAMLLASLRRAAGAAAAVALCVVALPAAADGWTPGPSLATGRTGHIAVTLANGKVLVAGGFSASGGALASAELYDPARNTWSSAGNMTTGRVGFAGVLLPDGRVLVMGGEDATYSHVFATAEIYDPSLNTWKVTGSMANARAYHGAVSLANGMVLVFGGNNAGFSSALNSTELYNPSTGIWSQVANLVQARGDATATLLANGKVLAAGGANGIASGPAFYSSAEIFDPAAIYWSAAASLNTGRDSHTASLLASGKVLVAGGQTFTSFDTGFPAVANAELYDPVANTWTSGGSLATARWSHTATVLAGGTVLVAGGAAYEYPADPTVTFVFSSAELYDPVANAWSAAASLITPRLSHTASLLANGTVLVVGGSDAFFNVLAETEIYSPQAQTQTGQPVSPQTGYWWNPAEPGRGFTIEQGASGNVFLATYLYAPNGVPVWYAAGPAPMHGATFSAPLTFYVGGETLNSSTYQPPVTADSPGNVTITFTDPANGMLTWPGGTIPITRFPIVPNGLAATPAATQPQAGYWWNPAEGGRGYTIEVQDNTAFIAAYMYDTTGLPVWYASGPATLTGGNTYQGALLSYAGGETIYGPYMAPTGATSVGNITIQFTSPTAGMLTLPDGKQIPIQRFGF